MKKEYDELVARAPTVDGKNADVKQEGAVAGVKEESHQMAQLWLKRRLEAVLNVSQACFAHFSTKEVKEELSAGYEKVSKYAGGVLSV